MNWYYLSYPNGPPGGNGPPGPPGGNPPGPPASPARTDAISGSAQGRT